MNTVRALFRVKRWQSKKVYTRNSDLLCKLAVYSMNATFVKPKCLNASELYLRIFPMPMAPKNYDSAMLTTHMKSEC